MENDDWRDKLRKKIQKARTDHGELTGEDIIAIAQEIRKNVLEGMTPNQRAEVRGKLREEVKK